MARRADLTLSPIGTHIAGRQIEILSSNVRALISMAEILLPPTDGDSMETPLVFDTDEKKKRNLSYSTMGSHSGGRPRLRNIFEVGDTVIANYDA